MPQPSCTAAATAGFLLAGTRRSCSARLKTSSRHARGLHHLDGLVERIAHPPHLQGTPETDHADATQGHRRDREIRPIHQLGCQPGRASIERNGQIRVMTPKALMSP